MQFAQGEGRKGKILKVFICSNTVTKRVYLTLADKVYDALERWAEDQGRPVANLAAYLVEKALEQAEAEGKIPPSSPKGDS